MVMPGAGVLLEQLAAAGLEDIHVIGADALRRHRRVERRRRRQRRLVHRPTRSRATTTACRRSSTPPTRPASTIDTVSFGALASDVVKVFAAAAEQACSLDGAALIEAIAGLADLEVTTGTVTYAGTNGVPRRTSSSSPSRTARPTFTEAFRPSYIPS